MNSADPRARLMALVAEHGVSLSGLSALLGRNASYLQQFVKKGSPRKLEENDRHTLAQFFGVHEAELQGDDSETGDGIVYAGARRKLAEWVDLPRLALSASAGPGAHATSELAIGHLRFSNDWLRRNGLGAASLSVIEVEGDSMAPTLHDGDEILVDRASRPLRAGIHVIRLEDVLLVKRIEPAGAERIKIISDNPAYPRIERPPADVEIVGRVVWKGGRL